MRSKVRRSPRWTETTNEPSVIEWLSGGGPWGRPPERVETHAAIVFLVGDRAYKLKRPVDLGYLDFTTIGKRHAALAEELRLNVRTAPALYLRLIPVTLDGGTFALGGAGKVVDWLLEMKRFPSGALLSELAAENALTEQMIEDLARHIAAFHDAASVVEGYDWPSAAQRIARENTGDLLSHAAAFAGHDLTGAQTACNAALTAAAEPLRRQSADTRRCHGDMHLANAFLDDGKPTLFDCIEFDAFYATIPPLYDLAFLLMDLIARGLPRHANRALNTWAIHRTRERWPDVMQSLAALPLYLALRAEIRAKVEAIRPGGAANAIRYLDMVPKLAERPPPRLIAIGGLSGTGKSSLAKALAWRAGGAAGAIHLRTDEVRKRLANVAPTERLPASAYTQEASNEVYTEIAALARTALHAGASVILDAVFAKEAERKAAAAIAAEANAHFDGLWLEAPPSTLEERISARRGDASDADASVLRRQLTYDIGTVTWNRVDASAAPPAVEQAALRSLRLFH